MRKSDAIKCYGSEYKIAKVLRISRQAVNKWPDVVPADRAIQLEADSNGKVRLKPQLYLRKEK